MNDKYLSVITNFGCHYSCPYCIVKNNHLNIPKTTIHGLNNLFSEIVKNRCNWVSLSGGGDPLWKYEQHKDWYEKSTISKNIPMIRSNPLWRWVKQRTMQQQK